MAERKYIQEIHHLDTNKCSRYVLGSKDQAVSFGLYDGKAIIREAQHEAIVVIPNYRVSVPHVQILGEFC